MARVAAYLRRSSPGEEAKNYSIESQLEDITAWAEKDGHSLVAKYSDPGGKSYTLNRPVLNQMMDDARQEKFDILAVWRFDRLSRIQEQSVVAIYLLKQYDVKVVSVTQPLPDGPMGTMMLNSYQLGSELELEGIRERTYRGKRKRVHSGKLYVSFPKYGYQFTDQKKERYEPKPETAAVVQRIFVLYASGSNLRTICRTLTEERVPTPAQTLREMGFKNAQRPISSVWRLSAIYRILSDTAYIGRLVGFKRKNIRITRVHPITGEKTKIETRQDRMADDPDRYEYPPEVCPPIVSPELWQSVQERMSVAKERSSRNTKHPRDVLLRSGLGRCGWCKNRLSYSWHDDTEKYSYRCSELSKDREACSAPYAYTFKAETLDSACWEWFIEQITHPEQLRLVYERYQQNIDKVRITETAQIQAVRTLLKEAEREEDEYVLAVGRAGSDVMRDKFIAKAEEAHNRAEARKQDLADLETHLGQQETTAAKFMSIQQMTPAVVEKLRNASIEDKRLALYIYKVRAWLWGKQHNPPYAFTWLDEEPPCEEPSTDDFEFQPTIG